MKYLLICLIFSFSFKAYSDDTQTWLNINSFFSLPQEWLSYAEFQGRYNEDSSQVGTNIYRFAFFKKLNDNFFLGPGFAWVETPNPNYKMEKRTFFQLQYSSVINSSKWIHRTRFELRELENIENTSQRLRQMLRWQYSFTESKLILILWNEIFWNLNSVSNNLRSGLDQNRFFVGLGFLWGQNKNLTELGYLNQDINKAGNNSINHILNLQTTFQF